MDNKKINIYLILFVLGGFVFLIISFWQTSPTEVYAYDMIQSPNIVGTDLLLTPDIEILKFNNIGVDSAKHKEQSENDDVYEETTLDEAKEIITFTPPVVKKEIPEYFTIKEHVVGDGENLWSISKNYNTDIPSILAFNNIGNINLLSVGTLLKVPNMVGIPVKIKKNDTLYSISKYYNVSLSDIKKVNKIKNMNRLTIGQIIFVPGVKYKKGSKYVKKGERFLWPSSTHRITSRYGWRMHPILHRKIFHHGLDIGGPVGTKIYASKSGKVYYAGWVRGYGKVVIINHSKGYSTRYAHLNRYNVSIGAWVAAGQLIGRMGRTGRVTGPHLHFEIKRYGKTLNPLKYVKR